jgi:hypothetical protein
LLAPTLCVGLYLRWTPSPLMSKCVRMLVLTPTPMLSQAAKAREAVLHKFPQASIVCLQQGPLGAIAPKCILVAKGPGPQLGLGLELELQRNMPTSALQLPASVSAFVEHARASRDWLVTAPTCFSVCCHHPRAVNIHVLSTSTCYRHPRAVAIHVLFSTWSTTLRLPMSTCNFQVERCGWGHLLSVRVRGGAAASCVIVWLVVCAVDRFFSLQVDGEEGC